MSTSTDTIILENGQKMTLPGLSAFRKLLSVEKSEVIHEGQDTESEEQIQEDDFQDVKDTLDDDSDAYDDYRQNLEND